MTGWPAVKYCPIWEILNIHFLFPGGNKRWRHNTRAPHVRSQTFVCFNISLFSAKLFGSSTFRVETTRTKQTERDSNKYKSFYHTYTYTYTDILSQFHIDIWWYFWYFNTWVFWSVVHTGRILKKLFVFWIHCKYAK